MPGIHDRIGAALRELQRTQGWLMQPEADLEAARDANMIALARVFDLAWEVSEHSTPDEDERQAVVRFLRAQGRRALAEMIADGVHRR